MPLQTVLRANHYFLWYYLKAVVEGQMLTIKVTGMDKIQRNLSDIEKVLGSLNGPISLAKIDQNNPESIRNAISEMEAAVDSKVAPYRSNPLIAELAEKMKAAYRAKLQSESNNCE
jgi:hypothetical protein